MTQKSHRLHVLFVLLAAAAAGAVELLTKSSLAHAAWAPTALGLLKYAMTYLSSEGALPPGPPAVVVLFLGVALACGGCKSVLGPVPPPGTPGFVDCSETALHQAELTFLPNVEDAAALADYSSVEAAMADIIAQLAVTAGLPLAGAEATCLADWVRDEASKFLATNGEKSESLESIKLANMTRWLAAHGANVKPAAIQ